MQDLKNPNIEMFRNYSRMMLEAAKKRSGMNSAAQLPGMNGTGNSSPRAQTSGNEFSTSSILKNARSE